MKAETAMFKVQNKLLKTATSTNISRYIMADDNGRPS